MLGSKILKGNAYINEGKYKVANSLLPTKPSELTIHFSLSNINLNTSSQQPRTS